MIHIDFMLPVWAVGAIVALLTSALANYLPAPTGKNVVYLYLYKGAQYVLANFDRALMTAPAATATSALAAIETVAGKK